MTERTCALPLHTQAEAALSSTIERAKIQLGRRYRQFCELLKVEGPRGITDRLRMAGAEWITPKRPTKLVCDSDVLAADLSRPFRPIVPKVTPGEPVIVNWVMIPGGPSSGGYTTIFRIIRYLEAHGYVNRIYFYNVYGADHTYYESIIRNFYGFAGNVLCLKEGMQDAHAVVATSWPTAYPVFTSRCSGKRFYFVQDFEPYFHPAGALSFLAENTYRMGFHAITAGAWLAQKLSAEFGMSAESFKFGSDTSRYRRLENVRRCGVVFYARPEAARRGFDLGLMAIEIFSTRHPEIELHFYGAKMGRLPFRFVNHGRIAPDELNFIYNRCYAGLSLSLTNASLVPHEMLAAGCIPVVNDAVHNRIVLENPFICYASPHPHALALELEEVVMTRNFESLSRAAAASVRPASWDDAGATVAAIFRRALQANAWVVQESVGIPK